MSAGTADSSGSNSTFNSSDFMSAVYLSIVLAKLSLLAELEE